MVEITLQAKIDNFDTLMGFVIDFSKKLGLDKKALNKVRLVAEEAIINVINYAYPLNVNEEYITVVCDEMIHPKRAVKLQVSDKGIPFNPLLTAVVDTTQSIDDRPIGGLGIHLVKKLADEVLYSRDNYTNTLTIIFYLTDENIDSSLDYAK